MTASVSSVGHPLRGASLIMQESVPQEHSSLWLRAQGHGREGKGEDAMQRADVPSETVPVFLGPCQSCFPWPLSPGHKPAPLGSLTNPKPQCSSFLAIQSVWIGTPQFFLIPAG